MNAGIEAAIVSADPRKRTLRLIHAYGCVSFHYRKGGAHKCDALDKAYCLTEDDPCKFRKVAGNESDT